MALVLKDRVLESSTSTGTGTFTLTGAQTGYQSFSVIGNGNTVYYTIQGKDANGNLTGEWEVGTGTWSTGNTLSRDTVLESSNANAKVVFSAGSKDVFCDLPAEKAVYQDALGTVTVPQLAISSTTSTTPTLSFNGSNTNLASGATVSGSYLQSILQNKSSTAGASTNYVLSNDLGTDSTYYGEFGMNSSVYSSGTPADFFSLNNGIYYSGHDGDVSIGSGNGYKTYFAWGTIGQSAHVINATGAIGLNTNITGTTNFGTAGQVLTSAGSAATPTWTSVAPAVTFTTGYIPFGQGTTTLNQSSNLFWDNTNARLGIGLTNPTSKLHLYDANTAINTIEVASGGAGVSSTRWKFSTNHYGIYVGSVNAMVFYNYGAGTEAMRIDSAGNVGIGTSSPTNYGAGYVSQEIHGTSGGAYLRLSSTTITGQIGTYDPTPQLSVSTVTAHPITFGTSGTERMRIFSSGGVSIGNTTDAGAGNLSVTGIIKLKVFTVTTLPSASTSGAGAKAFVSDALAPTFGATVVTGGAVAVPVYSDGTNWKVG